MREFIQPNWLQPENIKAVCSTRTFRASNKEGVRDFNLALHVNDDEKKVRANRRYLVDALVLPQEPLWLNQVHGANVLCVHDLNQNLEADASYANQPSAVCVIQTADCLPVLFCNKQGTWVAAAHAGWRGMQGGVLEETIGCYTGDTTELMAWLGPAIGPQAYEVGEEVYHAFAEQGLVNEFHFRVSRPNHWYMDLYATARSILKKNGVTEIYGGDYCTYNDVEKFYSYRRDGQTGRMASLIWIEDR